MSTPRLLVLLGLLAVGLAAAPSPMGECAVPQDRDQAATAVSCRLDLVSTIELSTTGGIGQIAVHGTTAAVVQRDDGIVALVDLGDPTAPTVVGSYDGGTGVGALDRPLDGDVAFADDGAYLFHARQTSDASNEGLHVLDITDPTTPTRVAFQPQGGMLRVAYARIADTEYVAALDAIGGLTISRFDRTPAVPVVTPVYVEAEPFLRVGGPASAGLVFTEDPVLGGAPLLYVADGTTGLTVYDVTDPSQPALLGAWSDTGLAEIVVDVDPDAGTRRVIAAREYWFDDQSPPELIELDATDLGAITESSRVVVGPDEPGVEWRPQGMHLVGGELYVAHSQVGLVTLAADGLDGGPSRATTALGKPNEQSPFRRAPIYAMDVHVMPDGLVLVSDAATGVLSIFRPAA